MIRTLELMILIFDQIRIQLRPRSPHPAGELRDATPRLGYLRVPTRDMEHQAKVWLVDARRCSPHHPSIQRHEKRASTEPRTENFEWRKINCIEEVL